MRPQVGVGVLIGRGDQVLLVRRHLVHGEGTWSTPGGHLEFGESPEECARREAMEEVGVHLGDVRFRALTNDVFGTDGRHYVTFWMDGEHVGGEPRLLAAHEMSEVSWFEWDALPAQLFLSFANLLRGRCYPESGGGLARVRSAALPHD